MSEFQEPWQTVRAPDCICIGPCNEELSSDPDIALKQIEDGIHIEVHGADRVRVAERIVACVNACVGLDTDDLAPRELQSKVRSAARLRNPLGGPDAQALEGALQQVERELRAVEDKKQNGPAECLCGCVEGELHRGSCDMERCPFCWGQLFSCDCAYKILGEKRGWGERMPINIYMNELTDEMDDEWNAILEEKGRIPFIRYPIVCAKCGCLWPEFFRVPNDEWRKYIEPSMRDKVVCKDCYDWIKSRIDEANEDDND